MSEEYSEFRCTPVLEPCDIVAPELVLPILKTEILSAYEAPFPPYLNANFNIIGVAENTNIKGYRLGLIGNSADERNDWVVTATDFTSSVLFNFKAALDLYNDFSDNGDPSVIDGYPAHLNFYGGINDDVASGGTQEDEFYGREGNDTFLGLEGSDYLDGGFGDDFLDGGDDDDLIVGGGGMDAILGGAGNDVAQGGRGNDIMDGGLGNDVLWGGRGDDTITDLDGDNVVYGNDPADTGPGVPAQTDNDVITTGAGNDIIFGGDGDDRIDSGEGDDGVDGGDGDDTIVTRGGNDEVDGGDGDDFINTGDGDDKVCAGDGNDGVLAGAGDDKVDLGDGDDQARGEDGNDIILGGDGNDQIEGNDGDDILAGNAGSDRLFGGDGNDTLWYGEGTDLGDGGLGDDTFAFDDMGGQLNLGRNLVADFTQDFFNGVDTIDLKCVEALTHMSVIELNDDTVRMIGFSAELELDQGVFDYTGDFDDVIFDIFVIGDNVGGDGNGILMQDSAYSSGFGPVCLNEGVLVDIGTPDDLDWVQIPSGNPLEDG